MIIMGSLIRGQVCSAPRWQRAIGTGRKEGRRNRRIASQGRARAGHARPRTRRGGPSLSLSLFSAGGRGTYDGISTPGGPGRKMFCFFFAILIFITRVARRPLSRGPRRFPPSPRRGARTDGRARAPAHSHATSLSRASRAKRAGALAVRSPLGPPGGGWHVYTAGGVTRLGGCRAQSPTAARGLLAGWSLVARAGLPKIL